MCDLLRRAVVSVTSNIAEGSGSFSIKEKIHFLEISYGSLMEVLSQMDIVLELGYISDDEFNNYKVFVYNCARPLSGLKYYFERTITSNH